MIATLRRLALRLFLSRLRVPRDVTRFACRRYAKRLALVHGRRAIGYAELGDRVQRMATLWRQWGIAHGGAVFCFLPDGIDQMLVRFAAAEAGVMLTTIRPEEAVERMAVAIQEIQPQLIVHPPGLELAIPASVRGWAYDQGAERALAAVRPAPDPIPLDPDGLAALGFTSGTTGRPKALAISHGAFLTSLRQVVANIDLSGRRLFGPPDQDRLLVGIPLTGAGSGVVLPSLLSGACLVIPERYDADALLSALTEHRITRMFTSPSLLIDILDHPRLRPFPHLRHLVYGTELMPVAKLEEAIAHFGAILQQGYGSAEVLPPVSLLAPVDHLASPGDSRPAAREILMSAGRIVPGVVLRIVDDAGQDLPVGRIGNVLIKSPTVFSGYWRRPDLATTTLQDGFLVTGDTGRVSADGYLTLLGRKADLVRRRNTVIHPRLVEEPAHDHPAVKEASLVQVGDQAVLAVSLRHAWRQRPPANGWCAEFSRHLNGCLAEAMRPDRIVVFDELPRSSLGKVLRREVRESLGIALASPGSLS